MSSRNQILHQRDFLRECQSIEDGSVDLILTDPPYGAIGQVQPWDKRPDFHVLAWMFSNLIKPTGQIAIFCDFATAVEIQEGFDRYFDFRFNWYWQKPSVLPKDRTRPANDIEQVLVYRVKGTSKRDVIFNIDEIRVAGDPYTKLAGKNQNENPTLKGGGNMPEVYENTTGDRFPRSILKFPNKPWMKKAERTSHPTQKPVAMLEYIMNGLSNPGDTVLDPFLGSGSTLVACHRSGRVGIGFELNEECYQMARDRLDRETAQGVLV